jgi:hypothetical protein
MRDSSANIRSAQPTTGGDLLVCGESPNRNGATAAGTDLYRLRAPSLPGGAATLGAPLLDEPDWNCVEAVEVTASRRPMGRLSNMDLSRQTGQILCLNANDSTYASEHGQPACRAVRVRLFTEKEPGKSSPLGEVEVQSDGSFMAEVPADIPLGFEALDDTGRVLRHEAPLIWVRPGENRSCIGCHEAHNHSPRNFRPFAVRMPVPRLCGETTRLVQAGR